MGSILLKNYLEGDGTPEIHGHRSSTVSKELAHGLQFPGIKLGYLSSLQLGTPAGEDVIMGRRVNVKQEYRNTFTPFVNQIRVMSWLDEDYYFMNLESIKRTFYKGDVFDVTVDGDLICSLGHLTHNCPPFLKAANEAIGDKIPILKAPIEMDACGSLADKYKVTRTPTAIWFDSKGREKSAFRSPANPGATFKSI